jgi:hypothetical protein
MCTLPQAHLLTFSYREKWDFVTGVLDLEVCRGCRKTHDLEERIILKKEPGMSCQGPIGASSPYNP